MDRKGGSIRFWLITGTVLAVLLGGAGFAATRYVAQIQLDHYAERFLLLSSLRKEALESYFDTVRAEITFWTLNRNLQDRQMEINKYWKVYQESDDKTAAGIEYEFAMDVLRGELDALAKLFVEERGYYDFFLIGDQGDVFYTVEREADLGTNLNTGEWRKTGLADVFRRAMEASREGKVVFSDLETYAPSAGVPAMFIARAMTDANGQILGVMALQLPTERIMSIMQFTAGMGQSGETYLVGEDLLMRSDSRFSDESTTLRVKVDTEPVRLALDGESGTLFTDDYRGIPVLSAYTSTVVDKFRWAVMAEIDTQEVLQTMAGKRPAIAGIMFFLYSLALWSFWYVRSGDWSDGDAGAGMAADIDYPDLQA